MAIYFSKQFSDESTRELHVGCGHLTPRAVEDANYAQADGDELAQACKILGRELPPFRVYTFCGNDARTIAANWR